MAFFFKKESIMDSRSPIKLSFSRNASKPIIPTFSKQESPFQSQPGL